MRKIIIASVVFLTIFTGAFAQNVPMARVKWYTMEQALELQKQSPRKIFIDIYTDWCGWCKRFDQETFGHPEVAAYLNTHFYPVKFNAESLEPIQFGEYTFINEGKGNRPTHQFAIALLQGQMSYPSVVFINEQLQLIGAFPGYRPPAKFESLMNYIKSENYLTTGLQEYESSFVGKIK
jgi:thioredoxin-related protein